MINQPTERVPMCNVSAPEVTPGQVIVYPGDTIRDGVRVQPVESTGGQMP